MKKAFSLIELLISLIIISLIVSAFAPMLSKKLKHREIAYSAVKQMKIDCTPFDTADGSCLLCDEHNCNLCTSSINVPDGYFVNPNLSCNRQSCSAFDSNCKRCTKEGCQECDNGYAIDSDDKCAQVKCNKGYYVSGSTCLPCSDGQYQPNDNSTSTSCIPCSSLHANCSSCNASTGCCSACSGDYELSECGCKAKIKDLYPSKENCAKINAIYIPGTYNGGTAVCVSKRNAGDSGGPTIPSSVSIRSVGLSGYTKSTTEGYCYKGSYTAPSASCSTVPTNASPAYTYEACNRTVCNWPAGVKICSSYSYTNGDIVANEWRLPTKAETTAWKSYPSYITTGIGSDGLELCDQNATSQGYRCTCSASSMCKGSGDSNGKCHAHSFWLQDESGTNAYYSDLESGKFITPTTSNKGIATSIRCVIEKFRGS